MEFLNSSIRETNLFRKLSQPQSKNTGGVESTQQLESEKKEANLEFMKRSKSCLASEILYIPPGCLEEEHKTGKASFQENHLLRTGGLPLDRVRQRVSHATERLPERKEKRSNSFIDTVSNLGTKLKKFLAIRESLDSIKDEEDDEGDDDVYHPARSHCQEGDKSPFSPLSDRPYHMLSFNKAPSKRSSRLMVTNHMDPNSVPSYRRSVMNLLKETDKSRMSVVSHVPPLLLNLGGGGNGGSGNAAKIDTERSPSELHFPDVNYDFQSYTNRTFNKLKGSMGKSSTKMEACVSDFDHSISTARTPRLGPANDEEEFLSVSGAKVFERRKPPLGNSKITEAHLNFDYKKIISVIEQQKKKNF